MCVTIWKLSQESGMTYLVTRRFDGKEDTSRYFYRGD